MQEVSIPMDNDVDEASLQQEIFEGKDEEEVLKQMRNRLAQLQEETPGTELVRREPLRQGQVNKIKKRWRNKPCICGSGKKFKKCCMEKYKQQTG